MNGSPHPDSPDAARCEGRGWLGHPRPLARLFTIEMWERMGFYGMRALLTLYLTKHFLLGDRAATGLYSGFASLVYLTPLVGGLLADRYIGAKRAVRTGALLMAAGYFAMALGGPPAKSWVEWDGERHAVTVTGRHDGPTTLAGERRSVTIGGAPLVLRGDGAGGIALVDPAGQAVRRLPPGSFRHGTEQQPGRLVLLLVALAAIAVGNGLFKPNISTMVGRLYAPADTRRDAGFTLFYMGINLGSIIGQFLCPLLADAWGWGWGFAAAGAGMLLAWALARFDGGRLALLGEPPAGAGPRVAAWIALGALACLPLAAWLFAGLMAAPEPAAGSGVLGYLAALPPMGKLLFASFALGVPAILAWSWRAGGRGEFAGMVAAMVLIAFNTVFWALFEQAGSSLTLFADRNTDRSVFGLFTISAPQTQNFNPVAVIALAPLVGMLWTRAARRGLEPSVPVKFALALAGVGAGFLLLVFGSRFAGPDARVGLGWLAGLYVVHSLAELLISPVGLAMVSRLAMARIVGLMMGMWFLSIAMGQYVAGLVAQMASIGTIGGEVADPARSLAAYTRVFAQIGWAAIAIGAVLLALSPLLRRLLEHGGRRA